MSNDAHDQPRPAHCVVTFEPESDRIAVSLTAGELVLASLDVARAELGDATQLLRERFVRPLSELRARGSRVVLTASDASMWIGAVFLTALQFEFDSYEVPVRVWTPAGLPTSDDAGPPDEAVPLDPKAPEEVASVAEQLAKASEASALSDATATPSVDALVPPVVVPREPARGATRGEAERPRAPGSAAKGTRPLSVGALLNEVEGVARRTGKRPEAAIAAVRKHPDGASRPHLSADIDRYVERGLDARRRLEALGDGARRRGADAMSATLEGFICDYPYLAPRARDKVAGGAATRQRGREGKAAARGGGPLTAVITRGPSHALSDLQPARAWTLLVDETGEFEGASQQGKLVGVLVPGDSPLVALPRGWHANTTSLNEIDRVVQCVLDAPVGVFGITADILSPALGDAWLASVLELVAWVCRLMPLDGPTKLNIDVEQRGEHHGRSSWQVAIEALHRELLQSNPARYRALTFDVRLVAKTEQPLNGYVDAIAFTWGSPTPASKERLQRTGLVGRCLHSGQARSLRNAWDKLQKGVEVSGAEWAALVGDPDTRRPGSIAATLLGQLAQACRDTPALWERFLGEVRRHLDSKAVHLARVGAEVEWLEAAAPKEAVLPAPLQLVWLTAKVERENHLGVAGSEHELALDALGVRLFDELPTFVCQADLDRAVRATNRFDFEGATSRLRRWRDVRPAVPGLRHYGRVWSSFGQHAAFLGLYEEAESHFVKALEAFARLAEPAMARAERTQTASYRAIAAIDGGGSAETVRPLLFDAVAPFMAADGPQLGSSTDPATKYAHHLLLRYLVHGYDPELADAYINNRDDWQIDDDGHPWPLISFYRALLLEERGHHEEACDYALGGVEMAFRVEQGPTVQYIGIVLAEAARRLGFGELSLADDWRPRVKEALPLATWDILADASLDGRTLLRRALPFTFR